MSWQMAKANNGIGNSMTILSPIIRYAGSSYDLLISDDVMVLPYADGTYKIADDSQYNISKIVLSKSLKNGNGIPIEGKTVDVYVRYANTDDFVKYPESMTLEEGSKIEFSEKNIVAIRIEILDLDCDINAGFFAVYFDAHTSNLAETGTGYNFASIQIRVNDEIVNTPSASSYNNNAYQKVSIKDYDLEHYGRYIQRSFAELTLLPNTLAYTVRTGIGNPKNIPAEELFEFNGDISTSFNFDNAYTNKFNGLEVISILPEGLDIKETSEELLEEVLQFFQTRHENDKYKTQSGIIYADTESKQEFLRNHLTVDIIKNYKNTNRTFIRIKEDFTDDPLVKTIASNVDSIPLIYAEPKYIMTYNDYYEYGGNIELSALGYIINESEEDFVVDVLFVGTRREQDLEDYNDNRNTNEWYHKWTTNTTINAAMESHQDVQTTVQTDQSNFTTGKVKTSKDSEYTYKLRVRTGQSDVTNLIIYDSIEDYAKNSDLEIVKASGGKQYWQGEFIGVDTSYAESKGYHVKVFYNENSNPGTLASDNTWQEYTDSTDKSKVKMLAFQYLKDDGTPAVLPANTNTYVLINMKSPNADYKTFSYNGCWTEWNAIDATTGRPVDFITGINSNIVKLALPTSVEPEDINITIKKEWQDGNNVLGVRPTNINVKLVANDDYTNAIEVPMTGNTNSWTTTVTVPRYDEFGEDITYTVREDNITVGEYYYSSTTNNYTITNSLNKNITLTKVWKDNTNAYSTRPSSITFKIKQNGNDYKTVTFGGNLNTNTWTETITVPVYDNSGTAYTYTIEEVSIDGYSSTCTDFTCTNTLTGNDNVTVKKVWVDNNNEYQTRPANISIRLKQNNNSYQSINLTGNTNTWESDVITVPKYDSNGVKYTYTIEETPVSRYGLVTYDQANLKVTNTLSENKAITITKKWIDDSNSLGLRPNELKINLLQNNNNYREITLTGTTDTWTTTIEVPKYDSNQQEYTYSIKELVDNVNEDYSNISYSEEELSVTNKLEKKVDITISKIWDDENNRLLTRPESITVNLLRNGEQFQELEITPDDINDNTWSVTVEDLDVYDRNGAKYTYTIEENLVNQLDRYETITYDQNNYTITNKLTAPPTVTLYFTVKNGYTLPGNDEILYDQEGYNDVLGRYNLNGEDEYTFHFELENVDTGEIIEGKLSTQGVLEFTDVPYGTYRAREGEDEYFDFVNMIEIEEVLGVTFKQDSRGGTITITPTGQDIVYGAKVTNKITVPVKNPETKTNHMFINILEIILFLSLIIGFKIYKEYLFLK
jgi:hypothetical protein